MINQETYIKNALDAARGREAYDEQVKRILADKQILAHILQDAVVEFRDA